ncbi:MAG: adenine phosphoribosyltransferase [Oscillospiraceae bacterium]|nr:adenine phosphoribosyltransferase [Oscillospiraceae bacterium]
MDLKDKVRHVLDFPKPGIDFIDITPLLQNAAVFEYIINRFVEELENIDFDLIACSEARGFILGAPVAHKLKKGFIPIRKQNKLPAEKVSVKYDLEYGYDILEIHADAVKPGQKVVIIDDILATGGTLKANIELIEKLGGKVQKVLYLIELAELNGKEKLNGYDIFAMEKM